MDLPTVLTLTTSVLAKKRSPTPRPTVDPFVEFPSGSGPTVLPQALPLLLVFGGALIVALIVYLNYAAKKRRRMAFIQLGATLNMSYSESDPFGLLGYPFALFRKGDGRGIENVLHGAWQELAVVVFDYWYYEESSDSKGNRHRSYYRFDCVLAPLEAACAHVTIDRENLFTRVADFLSFRDIEFESEDFNKAFNVKSEDKKFAYDLIDARMMQWLLSLDGEGGFEVMGNRLLVIGPKIDPWAIPSLLGVARGFVDHVPRVVYSLYPG
jgi:hypothetical protein